MMTTLIALLFSGALMYGQTNADSFKVWGKCGMCEKRIEKAALAVKGVDAADWNKDTKMLEVKFDKSQTSEKQIEQAVAKAGHDTPDFRSDDKVYDKLPACCHYERKPKG